MPVSSFFSKYNNSTLGGKSRRSEKCEPGRRRRDRKKKGQWTRCTSVPLTLHPSALFGADNNDTEKNMKALWTRNTALSLVVLKSHNLPAKSSRSLNNYRSTCHLLIMMSSWLLYNRCSICYCCWLPLPAACRLLPSSLATPSPPPHRRLVSEVCCGRLPDVASLAVCWPPCAILLSQRQWRPRCVVSGQRRRCPRHTARSRHGRRIRGHIAGIYEAGCTASKVIARCFCHFHFHLVARQARSS